jgi:hypothetical protein
MGSSSLSQTRIMEVEEGEEEEGHREADIRFYFRLLPNPLASGSS